MQRFRRSPWAGVFFCFMSTLVLCVPDTSHAATALEDVEWRLVELDGKEITVNPGERRPYILFDPSKKQASGYAGCNNFFGGYTLKGPSLSFGPLGSTRMACGEPQDRMEMKFLKALDATRSWQLRNGRLLLLKNDKVLARFERAGS